MKKELFWLYGIRITHNVHFLQIRKAVFSLNCAGFRDEPEEMEKICKKKLLTCLKYRGTISEVSRET